MKRIRFTSGLAAAFFACLGISPAALTMADITFWVGPPVGPGVSSAAIVVDWNDGQPPLAWGYRWDAATSKTSADALAALMAADPRLSLSGLGVGFVSHFAFDANLDGTPERFRPGFNPSTGEFWAFFVNNDVFFHPTDFTLNSHIVPPNTTVVPNGEPYAASNPGTWVGSSTGVLGRPLVNGSWDGYSYTGTFSGPSEPIPVFPIPEPATPLILTLLSLATLTRRKSAKPSMRPASAASCPRAGKRNEGPFAAVS